MKFEKSGVIQYPDYINIVSIYIGKLRDLYNVELNEKNNKYKRGELSELVNILGVKGELIVQNFLFQKNVKFTYGEILSNNPVKSGDVFIDINKIDVKTINDGAEDLLVNVDAHQKQKNITHYWFVQPLVDMHGKALTTANYWIYIYEEVSNWKIKSVKYTDAYYMNVKSILNEK
jgi:hypothetical protein